MNKISNLSNLGKKSKNYNKPNIKILEKVQNPNNNFNYNVRFSCPEFTSICPVTGQPDFGILIIDYVPNKWIVESKSFKLYLNSFIQTKFASKDDVVKQLNAFVQSIAMREYVNPKGALLQLQGKLATIGLSFDVPEMPGEKGKVVAELTQYGGRYGKDTDTNYDEVINDDGIAHRGIERKLEIEYETVRHGCTKVYAKIV